MRRNGGWVNQSLWVDTEALKARAVEFREFAMLSQQRIAELRADFDAQGRPWGDDVTGKQIEQSLLPDVYQSFDTLNQIAGVLRQFGDQLHRVVDSYHAADQDSARAVAAAGDQRSAVWANSAGRWPARAVAAAGDSADPPPAAPLGGYPDTGPGAAAGQPRGSVSRNPPARPVHSSPEAARGSADPVPASSQPGDPGGSSARPQPGSVGRPESRRPTADGRIGADPRPTGAGPRPVGRSTAAPEGASSWARTERPPRTPWTPNDPRSRSEPADPLPRYPRERRKDPSRNERVSAPCEANPVLVRLARMLADQYGIEADGFDAPGLAEAAVTEFVEAIEVVLRSCPETGLRAVRIAPCAMLVELSRGPRSDEDETSVLTITLDVARVLVTDPPPPRTVFAATVDEFGRGFDDAGGRLARELTHRALIGVYLGTLDIRRRYDTLARVVTGYRCWLATTFDEPFDPAVALHAGFREVMVACTAAPDWAKVLHRLLMSVVRPAPDGSAQTQVRVRSKR